MLSLEQKRIVESDKSTILVVAGAGCGKTFTITEKIKFILKNEMANVLVISFTNLACKELHDRINDEKVAIFTFHKLASSILKALQVDFQYLESLDDYWQRSLKDLSSNLLFDILDYLYDYHDIMKILFKHLSLPFNIRYFYEINCLDFSKVKSKFFKKLISCFMSSKKNKSIAFKHITELDYDKLIDKLENYNEYLKLKSLCYEYILKRENQHVVIELNMCKKLNFLFESTYIQYLRYMDESNIYSYSFMIKKASDAVKDHCMNFDYILVDEFQDINENCLEFLKVIVKKCSARIICVGDDWQSIYNFAGSQSDVMLRFDDFFRNSITYYLTKSFRYSNQIATISADFIQKDQKLLKKNMKGLNTVDEHITLVPYTSYLKDLVSLIEIIDDSKTVLILARYNRQLKSIKIFLPKRKGISLMTIHKSKGLEADYVITLMTDGQKNVFFDYVLPRQLSNFVLFQTKDKEYLEERRLFYVAMTRAKEHLFLYYSKDFEHPFIEEIKQLLSQYLKK